jgi:hypothetical protein
METRTEWEGTSTQLLDTLEAEAGERTIKAKSWPKAPNALSGRLRRLATVLRKIGIEVSIGRNPKKRAIRLTAIPQERPSSTDERSSSNPKDRHWSPRRNDGGDDRDDLFPTAAGSHFAPPPQLFVRPDNPDDMTRADPWEGAIDL